MKKLFFFFFLGFFAVSNLTSAQQMMIGVRGGVNLANEDWSDGYSVSLHPGILAGGEIDYLFTHLWTLSIQLLYDQKGAHADGFGLADGPAASGTADWTTSYLEIPILAKVSFGYGAVRPYLFAGPSIGFLLSNLEKLHGAGYSLYNEQGPFYSMDTTVNISDSTAKVDLSIVAGAGISFSLTSGTQFFVDASYAFGLINSDNYHNDYENGLSIYSRDIRIAAGVLFPLN